MSIKFNLIAAACENMGIGQNNNLPWRIKSEMAYFTKMTTKTADPAKKNIVIMGRKSWDCIPKKFKPLPNRINFVLSRSDLNLSDFKDTHSFKSIEDVVTKLENENFKKCYESVWVIGGSHIYKEAMNSKYFYRLYLTKILKAFECDTFFPPLGDNLKKISDPNVPEGVQVENDIEFIYNVYENTDYKL